MAGKPQDRPMVQAERTDAVPSGEPLFSEEMSLVDRSGSVGVTIPSGGVKIHNYRIGEQYEVEVHEDGIWIPQGASDE